MTETPDIIAAAREALDYFVPIGNGWDVKARLEEALASLPADARIVRAEMLMDAARAIELLCLESDRQLPVLVSELRQAAGEKP